MVITHEVIYMHRRDVTLSKMLEVRATLQMREMMETLCVHDTLAKPAKADISASISSSISSLSHILLQTSNRDPWCPIT